MASELQKGVPENLKKQLALAVRNIQWSYAIFWSISAQQPGVLEWGDGFYNGDIKTRKTVQAKELDANRIVFQRSKQLRELYESLSIGEASPQVKRPSAALSPEDLTDAEWYYLVCMSFIFNIGQGLPGRTYISGQPIWLCNAHSADSKVFSRSLLAKSASIQTIICFPFLDGVVELGVTDLVLEDPGLILHLKTSFLDTPYSLNSSTLKSRNDETIMSVAFDHKIFESKEISAVGCADLDMTSPSDGSNRMEGNQPAEDSFIGEGRSRGASQAQSWQFMDDEISNCFHHSINSSDCISQTFVEPEKVNSNRGGEIFDKNNLPNQEYHHPKLISRDPRKDDLHYQGVLATLFKSSSPLILGSLAQNCRKDSSFIGWKRGLSNSQISRVPTPQIRLKKILFEVPQLLALISAASPESCGYKDEIPIQEVDKIEKNHALSEKKRRHKLNERFFVLRSIVPSISKDDKVTILDEAIDYVKQLEQRVKELESEREVMELEGRTSRKPQDIAERTYDNYGNDEKPSSNTKKSPITKRKACDVIETETDESLNENISVSVSNKNVTIRMRCAWRDGVLLDIMDVISNFHLVSHSVQSSTTEGILSLLIKSKINSSPAASAGTIQQALRKVARNC